MYLNLTVRLSKQVVHATLLNTIAMRLKRKELRISCNRHLSGWIVGYSEVERLYPTIQGSGL
jgi:hypothetical protein